MAVGQTRGSKMRVDMLLAIFCVFFTVKQSVRHIFKHRASTMQLTKLETDESLVWNRLTRSDQLTGWQRALQQMLIGGYGVGRYVIKRVVGNPLANLTRVFFKKEEELLDLFEIIYTLSGVFVIATTVQWISVIVTAFR